MSAEQVSTLTGERLVVSVSLLHDVFREWQLAARMGDTRGPFETAALHVDTIAAESAEHFYNLLVKHGAEVLLP